MGKQHSEGISSHQEDVITSIKAPETPKIGSEIKEENRPIDKYFWFNISRTWVKSGITNVIEICGRLITAIAWFFGLGSSGFILSLFLGNESFKDLDLIFMFIPIVLFFISYGLAVLGQTVAIHREFEPNKHDTIRIAYNKVMETSKIYIISSAAALMGAIISIPIIINNALEQKKEVQLNTAKIEPILQGTFLLNDTIIEGLNKQYITQVDISGTLQDVSQARLQIEQGKSQLTRSTIEDMQLFPERSTGMFFLIIPTKNFHIVSTEDQFYVSVEYTLGAPGHLQRHTKLITATK